MGRHFGGYQLVKYKWSKYWYVTGGEVGRVSTGKTDRKEAEEFRATLIKELEKRESQSISISDALEDYMQEHAQFLPSKATTEYYSVPIKAFFGETMAEDVTANAVRKFTQQQRDKEYKDGTIRRQLTVLSAALHHARKEGRIPTAPHITMPSGSPPKDRWLTHAEAKRLLDKANGHVRLFILLALHTGQRKGAILDLKWECVDLKAKRIDFNPPGRKQTTKRRSVVPIMDKELLDELKKVKGRGYVITFHGKRVMDIKKAFKAACNDADLHDVTPHTLRHTAGTWMAQRRVPVWEISGVLGHSVGRTTELYLKHSPDHLKTAIGKLANNLQKKKLANRANPAKRAKGGK